ncbi:MAG: hypothetical protein ACOH1P_02085 [Lysobacter sp.]
MKDAEYFELHYYLQHASHSMDAVLRNKCEREVLAVFFEVARELQSPLLIETCAYSEGGLKELWKAIGKNNNQLTLVLAVVVLLFSRFPVDDPELIQLQKDSIRLEIEKTQLEIEQLKVGALNAEESNARTAETIAQNLQSIGKIAVRRSNYYKILLDYQKVDSVGYLSRSSTRDSMPEIIVPRSDFSRFVLWTDKLPVEVDESALIEVFAPVLTDGNYHWRGYYLGAPMSFMMLDPHFKASIIAKEIHFQNGTKIRCVLNIHRKYDELGEISITGYSVITVLDHSEGGTEFIETSQGRTFRQTKSLRESQQDLFNKNRGAS